MKIYTNIEKFISENNDQEGLEDSNDSSENQDKFTPKDKWDKLAVRLKDEHAESMVDPESSEDDPYNWYLEDLTVGDIIDFLKKYTDISSQ